MRLISTLILTFLLSFSSFSQNLKQDDLKVGLVLSGGGAKGMAHIGALKVIDSLGIRIDYIGGTSMGAIVGSLYASGYSAKQIDSIFKVTNFDNVLNDNLPRAAKTFYERKSSEKYVISLPFNDFKIKLPSAISRGQNVFNLLSRLTMHVKHIKDFSNLPIPFFCVATNIENGEAVILDSGNLAEAIKASGAFPSLFEPVNINGQLLIDGGVANNYPINILKTKGVDFIIGVDVQDDLAKRDDLKSATDILLQINNFRTANAMKKKVKETNLYIKPDITEFNVIAFDKKEEIINNGEKAAKIKAQEFKELASKQIKKQIVKPKIIASDSLKINKINIEGLNKYSRSYVIGKLKLNREIKTTHDEFDYGINNLVATNNFDSFIYELKPSVNELGYDLNIVLEETKKTTFIKLAAHYDDLYKTAILVNFTKKQLLVDSDVLSLDVALGDNIRYNFEYFIDKGFHWSIGINSKYNQFHKDVPASNLLTPAEILATGINKVEGEYDDFTNQLYIQTLFRKDFTLLIGAEHKHLTIASETILNASNSDKFFEKSDFLSVFSTIKLDTFDDAYFPNEGFYFNGDFHLYLYSSDFNNNFEQFSIAKANFGYAKSLGKLSAKFSTQGGFTIGENEINSLDFALGGYGNNFINNYMPFYGYDFLGITGNSFVEASLNLDYEIFKKNHINLAANFANVEDNLFDTGNWFSSPDYTGYAIGYSLETFIGPIEAKYTWSPETKDNFWFINLGFWF